MRNNTVQQLLRFGVVGVSCVAIDFLVYMSLGALTPLSTVVAKGISYICGMIVGFWGNKLWTFQSQQRTLAEPVFYTLIYAITFATNIGINQLAIELLGGEARLLAFLFATGITTILNFCGMKLLAFRRRGDRTECPESDEPTVEVEMRRAA